MKFADFDKKIIKDNVKYSVDKITEIIQKVGGREPGSKECFEAQEMLRKDLEKYCDETHYEDYKMAPKAFLAFTKGVSASIIGAIAAGGVLKYAKPEKLGKLGKLANCKSLPHAIVGTTAIAGLTVTAMEFLLYKEFCDPLFKKVTGKNLIATRKATEETKKRIVINGHIDSAYEWRHTYYGKGKGMTPIMAGSIVTGIASAVLSTVTAILTASGNKSKFTQIMDKYSYPFHFFTILNMLTLFAFVNFKNLVPGANDNLTGTLAAATALKMLDEAGISFKNTEVVAMITDGEEAGLRGAKQFAKDHYKEYVESGVETAVLCVDTLTDLEYLNVYSRDMTGTVKHDQDFCNLVMDAAIEAGHTDLEFANVFFGSSDAAAFTQAGITATCLAAMDPAPADYYHNRRDSYDRLVPEAIEASYDIIMSTILKFADEDVTPEKK
ncbi:MAG: M20/M25/M40 family metallo-hydrolase [Clostridia bacterium]|nr:M20/M25/M40 family metallo-hydrolase [Clostridia bacterium]